MEASGESAAGPTESLESVQGHDHGSEHQGLEAQNTNVPPPDANPFMQQFIEIMQRMAPQPLPQPQDAVIDKNYEVVRRQGAKVFADATDPAEVEEWLRNTERVLDRIECTSEQKLRYSVSLFEKDALDWSETIPGSKIRPITLTWNDFLKEFVDKYTPPVYSLNPKGSSCSFISHDFASRVHASIESMGHDLCVSMPAGGVMLVNTVVRSCPVVVEGVTLYADLVVINLREFVVILGMDSLSCNHALVDCQTKEITVEVNGQMKTVIVGERKVITNCLIFAMTTFNLIKGGCEAYIACVRDTTKIGPSVLDVPVVREFPDMFPEELLGLPPHREVDFEIETIPQASPISITPYIMAPLELK
ncbi:UNVERIFIED_CONTAM: hypothetical protein Sangu_3161100 [Sesamum angustifolium]|uniref:Uncharacterized protein n=1 Tax=Sesamum angustifolium TaxID=2727405 RepID=A0AAW2JVX0_9LAMI